MNASSRREPQHGDHPGEPVCEDARRNDADGEDAEQAERERKNPAGDREAPGVVSHDGPERREQRDPQEIRVAFDALAGIEHHAVSAGPVLCVLKRDVRVVDGVSVIEAAIARRRHDDQREGAKEDPWPRVAHEIPGVARELWNEYADRERQEREQAGDGERDVTFPRLYDGVGLDLALAELRRDLGAGAEYRELRDRIGAVAASWLEAQASRQDRKGIGCADLLAGSAVHARRFPDRLPCATVVGNEQRVLVVGVGL
jgi:hypothetical protein